MLRKIVVTGPESTGKSSLTKSLATYFGVSFVSEYARNYLDRLNRKYKYSDLLEIAKGQVKLEEEAIKKAKDLVIIDTELTVMDIWSQEKFGETDPWILSEMKKRAYDLYLIPDIDLEWTYDPQRENPNDRARLMKLYQDSFKNRNIKYHVISGQGEERAHNAIEIVKRELNV